jgi:site-specific DNA-cytosine methylase
MKLGGLFSGIGGFELAWTRLGGEVAWMCEWDKNARKVLEARFPGVPIYPDVRDLDPSEVEAVDVLTGGSPCQGFSVAGKRTGLEHGESQLFADYIRIMDGLAERGLKWALWENVPGVLSIEDEDGNRTFEHVVAALAGGTEPVRLEPERRWNTGLASGRGRAVAWRVLDSRFFGVAQRRRRVFACVAFGGACEDRAGRALLAVAEGVRGDSAEGVAAGQGAAGGVEGRAGIPSVAGTLGAKVDDLDRMTFLPDRAGVPSVTGTLSAGAHPGSYNGQDAFNDLLFPDTALGFNWQSGGDARGLDLTDQPSALTTQQTPAVLMTMREGKPGGGKGPLLVEEESLTLATGNGQTLFQPAIPIQDTRAINKKQGGTGIGQEGDPSFTLDTASRAGVAQAFNEMNFTTSDQHHVLRAGTKQSTGVVEPWGFSAGNSEHARTMGETQGISPPIRSAASGTNQVPTVGPVAFREPARAQSSDDAETWVDDGVENTVNTFDVGDARTTHAIVEPFCVQGSVEGRSDGAGPGGRGWKQGESFTLNTADRHAVASQTYGVRRLTPVECERLQAFPDGWTEPAGSDSARYKALGNAVTVNTVWWILRRMKAQG